MLKHCYIAVFCNKTLFSLMCYSEADCIKMKINVKNMKTVLFLYCSIY